MPVVRKVHSHHPHPQRQASRERRTNNKDRDRNTPGSPPQRPPTSGLTTSGLGSGSQRSGSDLDRHISPPNHPQNPLLSVGSWGSAGSPPGPAPGAELPASGQFGSGTMASSLGLPHPLTGASLLHTTHSGSGVLTSGALPPGAVECRQPDGSLVALRVGYVGGTNAAGRQHGEGVQVFESGDVYRGGWRDGRIDGTGCYLYRSGARYEGEFSEGQRHGQGRWVPAPAAEAPGWEGRWERGQRCEGMLLLPPKEPASNPLQSAVSRPFASVDAPPFVDGVRVPGAGDGETPLWGAPGGPQKEEAAFRGPTPLWIVSGLRWGRPLTEGRAVSALCARRVAAVTRKVVFVDEAGEKNWLEMDSGVLVWQYFDGVREKVVHRGPLIYNQDIGKLSTPLGIPWSDAVSDIFVAMNGWGKGGEPWSSLDPEGLKQLEQFGALGQSEAERPGAAVCAARAGLRQVLQQSIPTQRLQDQWGSECHVKVGGGMVREYYNAFAPFGLFGSSLGCIHPENPVRLACFRIICASCFQHVILVTILLNTVLIALDQKCYREKYSLLKSTLDIAAVVFQFIYLVEAAMKIIAQGFAMHKYAYLRSTQNKIDFLVVICGFADMKLFNFLDLVFPSGVNGLALLRLLKPVRMFSLIGGMRIIVVSLARSWHGILEVGQIMLMFLLLFAILGVQLYAGVHHQRCYYYDWVNQSANVSTYFRVHTDDEPCCTGDAAGGRKCGSNGFTPPRVGDAGLPHRGAQVCEVHLDSFDNFPMNFDNTYRAALVVFRILSMDDWPYFVHQTQSAVGWFQGMWYFILITILGTMFIVNLFLAELIEKYADTDEEYKAERARKEFNVRKAMRGAAAQRGSVISRRESGAPSRRGSAAAGARALSPARVGSRKGGAAAAVAAGRGRAADFEQTGAERLEWVKRNVLEALFRMFKGIPKAQRRLHEDSFSGRLINNVILLITLVNIVLMSVDTHDTPESRRRDLRVGNLACGVIFVAESFAKLLGLGARLYLFHEIIDENGVLLALKAEPPEFGALRRGGRLSLWTSSIFGEATEVNATVNGYNLFDLLLAVSSLPELVTGQGGSMAAFRCLRIFRLARVYRKFAGRSFNVLVMALGECVSSCAYVFFALFLFVLIFGLGGQRLFSDGECDHGHHAFDSGRHNFDSLAEAMLTVFIGTTGDSWTYTMSDMQASTGKTWVPFVYFIAMFIIGNYILFNLIAAVIVNGFGNANTDADVDEATDKLIEDRVNTMFVPVAGAAGEVGRRASVAGAAVWAPQGRGAGRPILEVDHLLHDDDARESDGAGGRRQVFRSYEEYDIKLILLQKVMASRVYEVFRVCYVLTFDVVFLGFERPTMEAEPGPWSITQQTLNRVHIASTILTSFDVGFQFLAFWSNDGRVHRDRRLMVLDLLVLCVGYYGGIQYKFLRCARSIRYIHVYLTSESRKVLLKSLWRALQSILQVVVLCFFVWLLFSVLGLQMFMGKLYYCNDPQAIGEDDCHGYYHTTQTNAFGETIDVVEERKWIGHAYGFNNFIRAFWTLLQISTGDSWSAVMFSVIDTQDVGENRKRNNNFHYALYFVAFMLLGGVCALNLFIGVLTAEFARAKDEFHSERTKGLTDDQLAWIRLETMVGRTRAQPCPRLPYRPGPAWFLRVRRSCYHIKHSPVFENGITVCILLNTVVLALKHYDQPDVFGRVEDTARILFAVIFAVEAAIKMCGIGPRVYFLSLWNRFDFVLAVCGLIAVAEPRVPMVNILRMLRIVRLTQRSRSMRRRLVALTSSGQGIFDVSMFMFGVFFFFAVIGVQLYGRVTLDENVGLLQTTNFRYMPHAVNTLYQSATFVRWRNIKDGTSFDQVNPDNSGCKFADGDCGKDSSWLYFLVFAIVGGFVTLNLFVTVVLENFCSADLPRDEELLLEAAMNLWSRIDHNATGWLPLKKTLVFFKMLLDPMYGCGWNSWFSSMKKVQQSEQGRYSEPEVTFTDVVFGVPIPIRARPAHDVEQVVFNQEKDEDQEVTTRFVMRLSYRDMMTSLILALFRPDGTYTTDGHPSGVSRRDARRLAPLLPHRLFTGDEKTAFFFGEWYAARRVARSLRILVRRRQAERRSPVLTARRVEHRGAAVRDDGDAERRRGPDGQYHTKEEWVASGWGDRQISFTDARVGARVVMTPEGCYPERYSGVILAKTGDQVTLRWDRPGKGGPPEERNIPELRRENKKWWNGDGRPHGSEHGWETADGIDCIASFPGRYPEGWDAMIQDQNQDVSVGCVFIPSGDPRFGQHAPDPEAGDTAGGVAGDCYCRALYGVRAHVDAKGKFRAKHRCDYGYATKEEKWARVGNYKTPYETEEVAEKAWADNKYRPVWGCAWFPQWRENIDDAVARRQRLVVYFLSGQAGRGIVEWGKLADPVTDPWDGVGLGASQKAEVAHLDRMGYDYKMVDVSDFVPVALLGSPTRRDAARDERRRRQKAKAGAARALLDPAGVGFFGSGLTGASDRTPTTGTPGTAKLGFFGGTGAAAAPPPAPLIAPGFIGSAPPAQPP